MLVHDKEKITLFGFLLILSSLKVKTSGMFFLFHDLHHHLLPLYPWSTEGRIISCVGRSSESFDIITLESIHKFRLEASDTTIRRVP